VCLTLCVCVCVCVCTRMQLQIINICMHACTYVCLRYFLCILIFNWLFDCFASRQLNKSWIALLFPSLSSYCEPSLRRYVNDISFLLFKIFGLMRCSCVSLNPLHLWSLNLIMAKNVHSGHLNCGSSVECTGHLNWCSVVKYTGI